MEDGVKGAKPSFTGKAGWVKKSSGKLLGRYKDRYIKVEKTEMVVFENQELQTCLERVDLEKYDKCLELRSTFKRKTRLMLIRIRKRGSKVHNVKLEVESVEEKEAWIKALNDAINRAKNKIFDEVKVDVSCSLDHVTRSRPQGNRSRRPPSRMHMKEVASVSCDGILRLDLDAVEHTPNGTHELSEASVEVTTAESDPIPKPPMSLAGCSKDLLQETPSEEGLADPTPSLREIKPREWGEEEPFEQEVASPVLNAPEPPASSSCKAEVEFVIGPVLMLVTKPAEYSLSPELLPELPLESVPEPSPESPQPATESSNLPAPPYMKSAVGKPLRSIPMTARDLLSSKEKPCPNVDKLCRRVAHELQTTQELLGQVCQEEVRGLAPEDLLMKAKEKLQLAQLCLREASTLKLCEPPSWKDKRTSW